MRANAAQLRSLRRREPDGSVGTPARSAAYPSERSHAAQMIPIIGACLALSAVTLLFPSTPTYDPWAWILWGREIVQLDLVTEGGPSWKPFPILFTAPFSLFGQDIAPYLWIWVARAGGLFGCAMAYRMATRLIGGGVYGVLAGVCAFLALFSSNKYVRDAALGNSEPLLAALVLWAFERHLDGRRDHALLLGFLAALLRPEAWPFLGLYGLWLWMKNPELRARLVLFALLIPVCWFLPEWWGSGDPLRAGARANAPNPGSAAFEEIPSVALLKRFVNVTIAPVELGTLIAVGYAAVLWIRRRAEAVTLALAAFGLAWFLLVAVMTEAGFAGNQRYLIVTTAVVCVLGGMGAVRVLQGVEWLAARRLDPRRVRPVIAGALLRGRAGGLADDRGQGRQHGARARRARARGLPLARPQGADRRGRRQGGAACLRRDLQRPLPDPDGGLRAGHPRHQRGLEGHAAAGRDLPHPHGARRAARDQAHRRPLPAGGHQRQVARAHRAARRSQRLSQGQRLRSHRRHGRQHHDQGSPARGDR